MKKTLNIINNTLDYKIREEQLEGKTHWVVPVVMMVEGVHNGSAGPLLYPAEELGRFEGSWNGMPVVINHPEEGSANTPELAKSIVGKVFNAHMEGTRLKAEAWLDPERLEFVSEDAYYYIQENRALEVSIGVYTENEEEEGDFYNEHYIAIARNLRPDHLALLPDTVGACSWDDGCGIRHNKQNKKGEKDVNKLKELSQKLLKEGFGIHPIANQEKLASNETGFQEIISNLWEKLNQMDSPSKIHYLEEVFDDDFVYRVHNRESTETQFFRMGYEVDEEGTVEFNGDPTEVRKETSFAPVENEEGSLTRTKFNKNKSKMKNNVKPCEMIDALINNESTHFTEDDREWLETLSEDQIKKLAPKEVENQTQEGGGGEPSPSTSSEEGSPKEDSKKKEEVATSQALTPEELEKQVGEILKNQKNPEEFIDKFFPTELAGQMKSGLKMYNEKRTKMIESIVENSSFTQDQLKGWNDNDLESLHDSVVPTDYSLNGGESLATNTDSGLGKDAEAMLVANRTGQKKEKEVETKN